MLFVDPDGKDITITIKDGKIVVSTNIYIRGSGANEKEAKRIKRSIETRWNNTGLKFTDEEGNEYDVSFEANVQVYDEDETELKEGDNLIDVPDDEGRSYVSSVRPNRGTWFGQESIPGSNFFTYAHEFGHLAGLKDRYSDNWFSSGSTSDKGWENNIMGDHIGDVDQRNIDGIVKGAVKKYNKFMRAYTNYQAKKNTKRKMNPRARYNQRKQEKRFKEYEKTGVFKYIKKPAFIRLTGE